MLYCFERYATQRVFYVNLARPFPAFLKQVQFDLVIFHDLLLCRRSLPRRFAFIVKQAAPVRAISGYRIATVQDEFTQTKLLNDFLLNFDVQHIFSVAPPSEWAKIYPSLDRNKTKLDTSLTGYLDRGMIDRIETLAASYPLRDIDIGYRASYARYSLGFVGYLKVKIAEVVRQAAQGTPLKIDVSNDPKDTIVGEDWYRFLLRCKYTLGVESGASVLDTDGTIETAVNDYLASHPTASFEAVQRACLREHDGELKLQVIGPRHLEACVTRTCQILTEGEYNGILKPNLHYLPLKKDFSNLNEVLEAVKRDDQRAEIVERAYNDIVLSNKYSFESYVNNILEKSLGTKYTWSEISPTEERLYQQNRRREAHTWHYVRLRSRVVSTILNSLPRRTFNAIEAFMKRT